MDEVGIGGDRITLEAHLRRTSFCAGAEEGRWEIMRYAFPLLEVRIHARGAQGITCAMDFQLECNGFPTTGPFIQRWDSATGQRPEAPNPDLFAPSLVDAFKPWNEQGHGYGGLYRPWQRGAAVHNNWARVRPDLAWHSRRDLTFLMEQLHGLVFEQVLWLDCRAAA